MVTLLKWLRLLKWVAFLGVPLSFSPTAFAQRSSYVVDGVALGSQVNFHSDAYQQYQCMPSEFPGLTWCHKEKTEGTRRGEVNSSNTILHKSDGTVVYANRYIEPAFLNAKDVRTEIERLSAKFGQPARQLRMARRETLPDAVIAVWGTIELEQLDAVDVSTLASGGSPHRGILISFLGDLRRSARLGVPVYRLAGGSGFVWAAAFNKEGRGVLRFSTIDASQIAPPVVAESQIAPLPQGPFSWSDCDLGSKNPERSIVACTLFLESGPASRRAEAFYNRGAAFAAKGNRDQAISDISESIRIGPIRAYKYQERGEAYLKQGEFQRALADFNDAIRMDPHWAFRFHFRALVYVAMGDLPRAISDFSEAIRIDPVKRSFRFHDRANAFRTAGQYEQAIADYDEALRLNPNNGWALVDRGSVYAMTGRVTLAKLDFTAALSLSDASPEIRDAATAGLTGLLPELVEGPPPPPPPRAGLDGLLGLWNNDETGENLKIEKTPLGYEAWISDLGQASLSVASREGANLELAARDLNCLYYVTQIAGERMNWQLRDGPKDKCKHGHFTRALSLGGMGG